MQASSAHVRAVHVYRAQGCACSSATCPTAQSPQPSNRWCPEGSTLASFVACKASKHEHVADAGKSQSPSNSVTRYCVQSEPITHSATLLC